ncbi:MerR family transcriptional regulator [Nocardia beijingensis]|uniref:MerR family transcriptional regulator n=1 Tax=Nocardia beijingensis TaxID=95162 RepID=UPI001E34A63E|nr:MerR family transcriptional regulator [Nocardia beijingensis]
MAGGDISIGELAARFGLATHVLRHWEDVGLLAPRRDGAGSAPVSRRRRGERGDDIARQAVGSGAGRARRTVRRGVRPDRAP